MVIVVSWDLPFGRGSRRREDVRRRLLRGDAVVVDARLRRTSSRGWGAWTDVTLDLGALPDGAVSWRAEDPIAVGLPSTNGPVEEELVDLDDLWSRDIRFRSEAFWGLDGEIFVLQSDAGTSEIAVPAALSGPLLDRLRTMLSIGSADG